MVKLRSDEIFDKRLVGESAQRLLLFDNVQVGGREALIVAASATVANLFESYLGAVVQGRVEWLTNDVVNMIQISLAAALAIAAQTHLI